MNTVPTQLEFVKIFVEFVKVLSGVWSSVQFKETKRWIRDDVVDGLLDDGFIDTDDKYNTFINKSKKLEELVDNANKQIAHPAKKHKRVCLRGRPTETQQQPLPVPSVNETQQQQQQQQPPLPVPSVDETDSRSPLPLTPVLPAIETEDDIHPLLQDDDESDLAPYGKQQAKRVAFFS